MSTTRVMLAELIGTFFLCFAGIAAILSTQSPVDSGAGIIGIALAHGLALSVAVACFGGVSGAHFMQYILAQLAGALLASWACANFFPEAAIASAKLGIPFPTVSPAEDAAWVTVPILLGVEFVLTFMLMTAIYGAAIDDRGQAVKIGGFAIGLTVTFDILAGGAITGASMNPARSFGPTLMYKLLGGEGADRIFDFHWCYWAAPIAGAVVAALIYEYVILRND
jgi:glycerol uptake facilitator-like aquaporin